MKEQLEKIKLEAKKALDHAKNIEELNDLKVKYLGKKGELTQVLRGMGQLSAEERPIIGQLANEVRDELNAILEEQMKLIKKAEQKQKLNLETIDITLPGKSFSRGTDRKSVV